MIDQFRKSLTELIHSSSTQTQSQGLWGNRLEFFLVCLGYRVDHLSMLRFPYFIYTHGGINCLLPCAVSVFVLGVPFHLLGKYTLSLLVT